MAFHRKLVLMCIFLILYHIVEPAESRNGLLTLEHAEAIGLGSREYELVNMDGSR